MIDVVPLLRERLSRYIESQPEYLLEHDGGPVGLKADVILATLVGFDDQVDAEWRIPKVDPVLLRPLPVRLSAMDEGLDVSIPTARYELQSNWAEVRVDWLRFRDMLPADVRPPDGSYQVTVALVRYRRR